MQISVKKIKSTIEFVFEDDGSEFALMTDAIGFLIKWAQEQTSKLIDVTIKDVSSSLIKFTIDNLTPELAKTIAEEYNSILMHWKLVSDPTKKVIN